MVMTVTDVTFCIPIGPAHVQLAHRAISSVNAQTVRCDLLTMLDTDKRGPGYLRNRMLEQVKTEFVVFLDADDWVEMAFAEETIAEYRRVGGDTYIYTNWIDATDKEVTAPCTNGMDGYPLSMPGRKPYCGGTWHVLTTLMPTEWARAVGGFDESMTGAEDTEFYLKMCTTMRCGKHLSRALFHYSPGGGRAVEFHTGPLYQRTMQDLTVRYGGKMGCCGDDNKVVMPIGQKQPGDVLVMALWHGNRTEYGRVTGRNYPRVSMPKTAWIDPRDAKQNPELWKIIEQSTVDEPEPVTALAQMDSIFQAAMTRPAPSAPEPSPYAVPVNEPATPLVQSKPDVSRVVRLANLAALPTDDPIFAFPKKDYPSYSDIKRLVELSGFRAVTIEQIDTFSRQPYIVVSPEPIPDLNGLRARIICWQLEYAGDYTENYKGFTGEVWASDKAWANEHSAKYVLLGSHPDLRGYDGMTAPNRTILYDYGVTMLGYMTPRREAIKNKLSNLTWPPSYPGHNTKERYDQLEHTYLMLHVHQHDNAPYVAPQRIAIAAAYHMPVVSETVTDPGALTGVITYADYDKLPSSVNKAIKKANGDPLHNLLCVERTFRTCVQEALKL